MLKRKLKDQEGPQEITIRYEKGRMIFEVGDREFFLTEAAAGSIFGRSVGIEFERLHGQDTDASELRSLSNFVKVQRLLRKGLNMDQVAKIFGATQEKLRQFYSKEVARPRVESWNINELENERKRQADAEMDFCREVPRPQALNEQEAPEPGEQFIDLRDIRNLRLQGKSDDRIAEHLGLDKKEFSKFLGLNYRYLDLLQ